MTKREVIKAVLDGKRPPYVPWSIKFTKEAADLLGTHLHTPDLDTALDNHLLCLGSDIGFFEEIEINLFRDVFGVVWDRTVDKDIGVVRGQMLTAPTLDGYVFPDPMDPRFFEDIETRIAQAPDRFRLFEVGFSLFERAWTLRGMEALMMDFIEHPKFVAELFEKIADYNIAQVRKALEYDIDAVYFGDDWGQQTGLIMGPHFWRKFILPQVKRMYRMVRQSDKYVFIHSCGDVDELFDDLIEAGLNCFNPFQPEVMDVFSLLNRYRGRVTFHGGLSTQKTLPYGTPEEVLQQSEKLLETGREGGFIFSPSHAVEGDVPLVNMLMFIHSLKKQKGFRENSLHGRRRIIQKEFPVMNETAACPAELSYHCDIVPDTANPAVQQA